MPVLPDTPSKPADKSLFESAFNNSIQPNIIFTVLDGKIISANQAACRLLGYSKKILLSKSKADILNINEKSFIKMLRQRKSAGHSSALVTAIKKDGTHLPCEITSAVFPDRGVEKAISTIVDMSSQYLIQKNIDLGKEKIVSDNIVIANTKQKARDKRNNKTVADNIKHAKAIQKTIDIKKDKIVSKNITAEKRKQKKIDVKKEKVVARDILRALAKSDARFTENREWVKHISRTSYDVMWDWDILTNKIYVGDSVEEIFGYNVKKNIVDFEDFTHCLIDEEKRIIENKLRKALRSAAKTWSDSYMFKRNDGSIAFVRSRGYIVRDMDGKVTRLIGATKDVSRLHELEQALKAGISTQLVLEEKLEHEIQVKKHQMAEATADAKDTERADIGKELHDNVNQLLGASKMYLEMAKRGGTKSQMYLKRSSEYTLSAIEEIRKLTKGLTTDIILNLGLGEAVENICRDIMETNPVNVICDLSKFPEFEVNDKFKLTVFRVIQEQLNNILKHAGAGKIKIRLDQTADAILLSISDNGVGFDTGKKRDGIGVNNIKSRVAFYNGTADFSSRPGKGCVLKVKFPLSEQMARQRK